MTPTNKFMKTDELESRRARRVRKVVVGAMGRFVIFPWLICGGLWMLAVVAVGKNLRPDLDPNGWPFILRAFPIWIAPWWLTIYGLWAVEVRLLLHRKGPHRTVRYLFPEALSGREGWVDRTSFLALGIRPVIRKVRGSLE